MITSVHVKDVISLQDTNVSRTGSYFKDNEDFTRLSVELAAGWDPAKGALIVRELTADEIKDAVAQREAFLADLESSTQDLKVKSEKLGVDFVVSASDYLRTARELFVDGKKIHKPKYAVVAGHRRVQSFPFAQAILRKAGRDYMPDMFATVQSFGSMLDWQLACVNENVTKNVGARGLSDEDKVRAAVALYQSGGKESDLQHKAGFSRGMAQKLFAVARVNGAFPDSKIADRIIAGEVKLASCDKEVLRTIANSQSQEALDEWLNGPKAVDRTNMAQRKDIQRLAEQSPILPVKLILNAVLSNNLAMLSDLLPKKDAINESWRTIIGS